MAEAHLDHPGDVTWFKGYGPRPILEPCPHRCDHHMTSNIGWGPDFEHYVLDQCDVPDGCGGMCRAWAAEYPEPFTDDRPKHRQGSFLHVGESDRG